MARQWRLSPTVRSIFAVVDGLLLFLALEGAFYAVVFLGLHRSADRPTSPYPTAHLIWAILAGLAAGFLAGRVAGRSPVLHGFAAAVPLIVLGLLRLTGGHGGPHTALVVIYNLLVPLSFLVGAWLTHLARPGSGPHRRR